MKRFTSTTVVVLLLLGYVVSQSAFPLQIKTYFDAMDKKYTTSTPDVDKYLFSKQIMIRVVKYYSQALTVKTAATSYTYTDFTLNDKTTVVPGGSFTGHLFTVFDCYTVSDKTFASAANQDHAPNGRPISGIFHLNLNAINPSPKNALAHYGTFVHEFYHILTFNSDLYDYYINAGGTKIGKNNVVGAVGSRQGFILAGDTINFAKTFLGDTSLSSILLENGGGSGSAGSHWEYDYFPNDFMSPIDTLPSLLSPLSMYLSKDSGWYGVVDDYLDPLVYGKGAGANFQATGTCPGDRSPVPIGFCASANKGNGMCSPDGMYKGVCNSDTTYNGDNGGCPFIMGILYCTVPSSDISTSVNSQVEVIGAGARCVTVQGTSGNVPACATTSCSGSTLTYTFANGASCSCSASDAGNKKTCGSLTVVCPDTTSLGLVCDSLDSTKNACPSDCNGKGFCLGLTPGKKQCWCKYGWTGSDCSTSNADEPLLTTVGTTSGATNKKTSYVHRTLTALAGVLLMVLSSFI